jgi:hypothetical protein
VPLTGSAGTERGRHVSGDKCSPEGALDPLVAKYQSRAFKVSGDAVPMEFGSAINSSGNIAIRIGTNLGDVMVEGSDLGIALQSPSFCPIEQTIIPPVGQ